MRVRKTLGLAVAVVAAAALAACGGGHAFGDGGRGGGTGYHPNPHDSNVVILVDAGCTPIKSDPGVGFSKQKINWRIRSECAQYNGHDVWIVFTDLHGNATAPIDNCPCKGMIDQNGIMNLQLGVGDQRGGFYTYEIRLDDPHGTKLIDPDLEIDP